MLTPERIDEIAAAQTDKCVTAYLTRKHYHFFARAIERAAEDAALERCAQEMRRRAIENANTTESRACYENAERAIRALRQPEGKS